MRKPVVIAVATGVAASLAALGVVAATSATAHSSAAESTIYIKKATTSYSQPTNQSAAVHYGLKEGQTVVVRCFTEGQELQGNHYWLKIAMDGKLGYVHRDAVALVQGIPHC
jgi:hypothetical protein